MLPSCVSMEFSPAPSPPHKHSQNTRQADCNCNGRQGDTEHTDFGSWEPHPWAATPASTQQQQLFHIIGFKWYLWVEVLGVTSSSSLEAMGELLGHNAVGSHRAGCQLCQGPHMDRQVWDICLNKSIESQCNLGWKGILRLSLSANPALPHSPLSHVPKMPH